MAISRYAGSASLGVGYSNIESMTYYAHANATTTNITGTPASIPPTNQTAVYLGNNADTVTMFPVDANGLKTIQSPIGIDGGGGTDSFAVNAIGTSTPIDYQFLNPYGPTIQNIRGIGPGGVGTAAIESVTINAGDGGDTFFLDQYTSGVPLAIYGGGGSDTCGIGNGDLSANITNIAAFTFDGPPVTFQVRRGASANRLRLHMEGSASDYIIRRVTAPPDAHAFSIVRIGTSTMPHV